MQRYKQDDHLICAVVFLPLDEQYILSYFKIPDCVFSAFNITDYLFLFGIPENVFFFLIEHG